MKFIRNLVIIYIFLLIYYPSLSLYKIPFTVYLSFSASPVFRSPLRAFLADTIIANILVADTDKTTTDMDNTNIQFANINISLRAKYIG